MIIFFFVAVLSYGDVTLIAKPTMQACQQMRQQVSQLAEVSSVTDCMQGILINPEDNAKGGA